MNRINPKSKIYKPDKFSSDMKKRADVTLDVEVHDALEKIRSEPQFKPSLSEVVNYLLKTHPQIKKRLKKK